MLLPCLPNIPTRPCLGAGGGGYLGFVEKTKDKFTAAHNDLGGCPTTETSQEEGRTLVQHDPSV